MVTNSTVFQGILGTGVQNDSSVPSQPMFLLNVAPQSTEASTTAVPVLITQQTQPVWTNSTKPPPTWQQVSTANVWTATFPNSTLFSGTSVIVLDCLRNVQLTFSAAVTGTVTVTGWDAIGRPVVATGYVAGSTTAITQKCFKMVSSVQFSAVPSSTTTVLVEGGSLIGLPYALNNIGSVVMSSWADTPITNPESLYAPGAPWRTGDAYYQPTSQDCCGSINLSTLIGSEPMDGENILSVYYYVYGNDGTLDDQLNNLSAPASPYYLMNKQPGSSRQVARIANNEAGQPTLPHLVNQDLFGAQFPYDNAFMDAYMLLLAQD